MNLYNDYSSWVEKTFGYRVQKIAVDAGFSCPNRDGTKSLGGCIFCDNKSFNPPYCSAEKSVRQQLDEGKRSLLIRETPSITWLIFRLLVILTPRCPG